MTLIRNLIIWLLAPLPRVPGAPLRFRRKVEARLYQTDRYEGHVTTGDNLFSGESTPLPALIYHDMRFEWQGQIYRIYWHDGLETENALYIQRPIPAWVDPWDLSSVWFLGKERKVTPVSAEDHGDEDQPEGPLIAVDVHYREDGSALAAAIAFDDWHRGDASASFTKHIPTVAPYQSGAFYKRELPCILALIKELDTPPSLIIIDGYVTLGANERDGLGMHLYRALNGKIPVIGVAKTHFDGTPETSELYRGASKQPLYVTSAGMSVEDAKTCIKHMHGEHRMPTLLRQVDQLSRQSAISTDYPSSRAD